MTPDKFKLINALASEYEYLCHDDFDPDEDPTPEEYKEMLMQMSYDELIEEASSDDIDEFIEAWS